MIVRTLNRNGRYYKLQDGYHRLATATATRDLPDVVGSGMAAIVAYSFEQIRTTEHHGL